MLNLPNRFARATCDRFVESMCCRPAQPISASSESSSRVAVFQCTAAHTRKTQVILTDSSAGELDWHHNRCRPGATMPCSTVEGLSTKRNTMARARRHKSERPTLRKKAAVTSKPTVAEEQAFFTLCIIDSETQQMLVVVSLVDALSSQNLDDLAPSAPGAITQVIIPRYNPGLLEENTSASQLHPMLVDDFFHAYQQAKVDRYDDVIFV